MSMQKAPLTTQIRKILDTDDQNVLCVEGYSDKTLFSNFITENTHILYPTEFESKNNKTYVIDSIKYIIDNFLDLKPRVAAIVDSDYMNSELDQSYDIGEKVNLTHNYNIYFTDKHDIESQIIASECFFSFMMEGFNLKNRNTIEAIRKSIAFFGKDYQLIFYILRQNHKNVLELIVNPIHEYYDQIHECLIYDDWEQKLKECYDDCQIHKQDYEKLCNIASKIAKISIGDVYQVLNGHNTIQLLAKFMFFKENVKILHDTQLKTIKEFYSLNFNEFMILFDNYFEILDNIQWEETIHEELIKKNISIYNLGIPNHKWIEIINLFIDTANLIYRHEQRNPFFFEKNKSIGEIQVRLKKIKPQFIEAISYVKNLENLLRNSYNIHYFKDSELYQVLKSNISNFLIS